MKHRRGQKSIFQALKMLFVLAASNVSPDDDRLIEKKINFGYDFDSEDETLEQGAELSPFEIDITGTFRRYFAVNFLQAHAEQTMVCSPLAAVISLGQLAMGADGRSLFQLLGAIGIRKKAQVKPKFKHLIKVLIDAPGVKITATNKIFLTNKVHVRGKFDKDLTSVFKSDINQLNFDKVEYTKKKINKWIENESNRTSAVDIDFKSLIGIESSIIISIARISGKWRKPFRNVGTYLFHSPNGLISLPIIRRQGYYNYHISYDLHAQIVELPFMEREATFVVVLPFTKTGLTRLIARIKQTPEMLNEAFRNMTKIKVIVSLPKFSIQTNADVEALYKSMGIEWVFRENSGLNKIIVEWQMIVQLAWQVAIFNINENGTETTGPPAKDLFRNQTQNKNIFNAMHPFLFYVNYENEQILVGTFNGV